MISANLYFWTQVNMLIFMFRKHSFEFRKHAVRQIALLFVTPVSIWVVSIDAWLWLLWEICERQDDLIKASVTKAGLFDYEPEGICSLIDSAFANSEFGFYSAPF